MRPSLFTRRQVILGGAALAASGFRGQPAPAPPALSFLMPPGATDCHAHVFCDTKAFPLFSGRSYTPEPAPVAELQALHRALSIERVVFVQPSVYGTDNTCMLAAIREVGSHARGVAVVDERTPDGEVDRLHLQGVRGIRINLETTGQADPSVARERFQAAVRRIGSRPLHIQMFTRPTIVAAIRDLVAASPATVVFDHFGGAKAAGGVQQPGFDALLALVQSGKAYVKVSGAYRGSTAAPDYADMAPLAKALIAANPRRVLWGSDWPHPNTDPEARSAETGTSPRLPVEDARVLSQLAVWAPAAVQRRVILVENPARLYGW